MYIHTYCYVHPYMYLHQRISYVYDVNRVYDVNTRNIYKIYSMYIYAVISVECTNHVYPYSMYIQNVFTSAYIVCIYI